MGRRSLFFLLFILVALELSAQTGGYSSLQFIENRGQWDSIVKFRAEINTGTLFMRRKGFTVLLNDTADVYRINRILHGDLVIPTGAGKGSSGAQAAGSGSFPKASGSGGALTTGAKTASSATKGLATSGMVSAMDSVNSSGGGGTTGKSSGGTKRTGTDPFLLHSHVYEVNFVNASDAVQIVTEKGQDSYNNYFIGDRKNWATHCRIYQGLTYKNLYPGIDLHYYTEQGFVKYDLIVHPGADPDQIILDYKGEDKLSIKKNQVFVSTSVGTVKELEPRSYQVDEKGRTEVSCKYVLEDGHRIRFKLGSYSGTSTLVIDPTEVFCSFTGSRSDNWGYTATYDNSGNFYMGGIVLDESNGGGLGGNGYPVSPGAFQTTYAGGDGSEGGDPQAPYNYDVAIMKLSANGANKIYATYLGGSGDEQPHSMIVDNSGDLIVTGRTSSKDFPPGSPVHIGPTAQTEGFDIFITKFNSSGTGLLGSMTIGGTGNDGVNYAPKYDASQKEGAQELRLNYGDDGRGEVILDAAGNIYVATSTQSTDFPATPGSFQPNFGGGDQDGVLIKAKPDLSGIYFASYIGGSSTDAAFVLALNPNDNTIWVGGGTLSTDFPGTGNGTVVSANNSGGADGFVSEISNDGKTRIKSSYYGTGGTDMIYGIEFDKLGFPYVMGTTTSVMPVVNSPFNAASPGNSQANGKQFITKFKQDLSGIVYSANFGPANNPSPNISPTAFLVDRCENVYVAGWGGGADITDHYLNSGTTGLTPTPDAIKSSTDGEDFYFFILQKNAASQLYGSFFGQQGGRFGDHVDGGTSRFDKQGVIYEAVCANCYEGAQFPTTPGAYATANGTGANGCNEAAVKIAFNFSGVYAGLKFDLYGRGDSVGCTPLTVTMEDTVRNAKSYIWNFGDGSPQDATTSYTVTHTYTAVGTYRVMLVAIDSNTCNVADTAYRNIVVKNNPAFLNFDFQKVGDCNSLSFDFFNTSQAPPPAPPFGDSSFQWVFGDQPNVTVPGGPVSNVILHTFPAAGTYNVILQLIDTNYCNYPQADTQQLYISANVKAQFVTPATGCAPYSAVFDNTSLGGVTYLWDFGDGTTSTLRTPPPHYYPNPGTFTITLTVDDPNTCNKEDKTQMTITLLSKPTAGFAWSPDPPVVNTPTAFTSASSPDVVKWDWMFGDGASEVKETPDTALHQYEKTGTFQACLAVFNSSGCSDTLCQPVAALINPLLDVPNAFTPGRFGQNGIVKVVGFGMTHIDFRIYNRWGQLVFESNDPNIGWDGTYHGELQAMDVYAYTLTAEFFDGTHAQKKGSITLIR